MNRQLRRAAALALALLLLLSGCIRLNVDTTRNTDAPTDDTPQQSSAEETPVISSSEMQEITTSEEPEPPVADCFALHCDALLPATYDGVPYAYESQYATLLVTFDEKDAPALRLSGVSDLDSYAKYCLAADKIDATLSYQDGGLPYYTMLRDGGDDDYYYFVAFRESDGRYWTFRYLCGSAVMEEYAGTFAAWAAAIEMGAQDGT